MQNGVPWSTITISLHPLHASLFKLRIRKRLLSRLSPMRPFVMRGVGRVFTYWARPFWGVVDCIACSGLA
jgi:hypothetical protein